MNRNRRQTKDDKITFRIQENYMKELRNRAEENGVTPHIFSRMLVQEALKRERENEILERLDLIEDRFDEIRSDMMQFIKEIFIGLGHVDEEDFQSNISGKS
ncbi:MAG: hypothetical protein KME07_04475 [Pegethrix bostrychoides GSE-TBD4-15B]|jgi:hypothetical protein|uniref:Uncharacterized protein n=1 Tax=Pegethrix bostrychoides GSE-TBD4-15B TaxID=2839662 RepID=A0A951P8Q5_9CYAN|nr:hypothetical protein [Pegethrix bostrychoides GSE-TBD4-15B]